MVKLKSTKELTDRDKRMIKLWNEGFTGQMMAEYFGQTRNAILGRLMRLRDAGHDIPLKGPSIPHKKKQARPMTYKPSEGRVVLKKVISEVERLNRKATKDQEMADALDRLKNKDYCKDTRVRIHGLQSHHCRYVIDNQVPARSWFCGHPKEKGSYCAAHAALCYMPEEKKQVADRIARSSIGYGRQAR